MTNSSVFIVLMVRALHRMIYENEKSFFCKNSLNVPNVKLFSILFFNVFSFFMHFCWEWDLLLYILSDFPGLRYLSNLNDLYSLISTKNYWAWCFHQPWHQNDLSWSLNAEWIIKNPLFYWFLAPFLLEAVDGTQHRKNQNWLIRHKCSYLMNT